MERQTESQIKKHTDFDGKTNRKSNKGTHRIRRKDKQEVK